MSTEPPSDFFEMSSILTGFTVRTLRIAQQSADFYGVFDHIHGGGKRDALMAFYADCATAPEVRDAIGKAILAEGSPVADTARALMIFWYLGQVAPHDDPHNVCIPSGNHYAQGLAWRAVQAHPTGVSTQDFGYWAEPPAPLDDYL